MSPHNIFTSSWQVCCLQKWINSDSLLIEVLSASGRASDCLPRTLGEPGLLASGTVSRRRGANAGRLKCIGTLAFIDGLENQRQFSLVHQSTNSEPRYTCHVHKLMACSDMARLCNCGSYQCWSRSSLQHSPLLWQRRLSSAPVSSDQHFPDNTFPMGAHVMQLPSREADANWGTVTTLVQSLLYCWLHASEMHTRSHFSSLCTFSQPLSCLELHACA
jgi:hypothetical protein